MYVWLRAVAYNSKNDNAYDINAYDSDRQRVSDRAYMSNYVLNL